MSEHTELDAAEVAELGERLTRSWVIGCSRCSAEGAEYVPWSGNAAAGLRLAGWRVWGQYTLCPPCAAEVLGTW